METIIVDAVGLHRTLCVMQATSQASVRSDHPSSFAVQNAELRLLEQCDGLLEQCDGDV